MAAHAVLSPSSAVRWMACPGSVVLSDGMPERRSAAAARGTVAHTLAALCLINGTFAPQYVGQVIDPAHPDIEVDQPMAESVQQYVDEIREYADGADDLMVEVRVPIGHLTGEEDAGGTADAIIIRGREIQVHDYKSGFHEVQAEDNPQLKIYALGALHMLSEVCDFDTVLGVIHQPEHGGPKEARWSVEELSEFATQVQWDASGVDEARHNATTPMTQAAWEKSYLNPTAPGCLHCPARATCPALKAQEDRLMSDEFADLTALPADKLGEAMDLEELVEIRRKAVRAEVERRLFSGAPVAGYKLVQGRRGARKWSSPEIVETLLVKYIGADDAYDRTLISPTTAEKRLKTGLPATAWQEVATQITQPEGKPSVAKESDKRDAISVTPTADEFSVVDE